MAAVTPCNATDSMGISQGGNWLNERIAMLGDDTADTGQVETVRECIAFIRMLEYSRVTAMELGLELPAHMIEMAISSTMEELHLDGPPFDEECLNRLLSRSAGADTQQLSPVGSGD